MGHGEWPIGHGWKRLYLPCLERRASSQRGKTNAQTRVLVFLLNVIVFSGSEGANPISVNAGEVFMGKPKIFVRDDGQGRYRYTVVAAQGGDVHFHKDRFSRAELEVIAKEMDAELVFINVEEDIEIDEEGQAPESEESEDVE